MNYILEIASFTITGALTAQQAGANRIELCENPSDGGTTPSYGILKLAREKISIPVFPIIRPRGGDFFYSPEEIEIIKTDIKLCKQLGFEGVVIGMLLQDGTINTALLNQICNLAYPMDVTFHRAFDRCLNPLQAIEEIIQAGCTRILTSGQYPTALEGKTLINKLIEIADERIIILPGSGIRANNIAELKTTFNTKEFHSGARKNLDTQMSYSPITMNEKLTYASVDENEVKQMRAQLDL